MTSSEALEAIGFVSARPGVLAYVLMHRPRTGLRERAADSRVHPSRRPEAAAA